MSKWLDDTLAAIKRIARGSSDDQEVKDSVAQLKAQLEDVQTRLTANAEADAANATDDRARNDAAEEMKATLDALVTQLAESPPVEDTDNG